MADDIERPSTPPRQSFDTSHFQATPEHVKQREINRLKGLYAILLFQSLTHHFAFSQGRPASKRTGSFIVFIY